MCLCVLGESVHCASALVLACAVQFCDIVYVGVCVCEMGGGTSRPRTGPVRDGLKRNPNEAS